MSPKLRKRLPLLLFIAVGLLMWRGGFGFLAAERTVVWRLPVAYSTVRAVDLQLWDGDSLLKREELHFGAGITEELRSKVTLSRGEKRALATVSTTENSSQTFVADFDPGSEETVVVSPSAR